MAIPPSYCDLGKAARDLFEKGFNYGFSKLDLKTKTGSGIEFTSKGVSSHETGKIDWSLETKYKQPQHGLTFSEKWTTENKLTSEIAIEDQIACGLKLALVTSFSPNSGKKSGSLKTNYKRDYMNLCLNSDFNLAGPTISGSAVFGYEGWNAGYQFGFDTSKSALSKSNVALAYNGCDYQLLFNVQDATDFGGSIFHCINSRLATAIQLAWSASKNTTRFGIGGKYDIDSDASLSGKVNNVGQVGVGYSHMLRKGVKLNFSALIDGKNFNAGGHKVGIGLEFDL